MGQLDVPINAGIAWAPDVVTTILYRLPLPADLPPGAYKLSAVAYSWTTGAPIELSPLIGGESISKHLLPDLVVEP